MRRCPVCSKGELKEGKTKEYMFGVYLGQFPAKICDNCGESFTDSAVTKQIEEVAKKKGVWGLGAVTRITRAGNSLAVRIPKRLADYMNLKEGEEAYISPEDCKIVIEKKN